jgi:hypothetical protein
MSVAVDAFGECWVIGYGIVLLGHVHFITVQAKTVRLSLLL